MIKSYLSITPLASGDEQRLLDLFDRERILEQAMAHGCTEVEMWRPRQNQAALVVCAEWKDQSGYDAWVSSAVRDSWQPQIAELTAGMHSTTFDILRSVRGRTGEV